MTLTRLLLVDDHPIIFEGLAQLLNHEQDMRAEWFAADAEAALRICEEHTPDMAIVDISLGGGSGIDLIKTMASRWPSMPVLVLSMHEEAVYAERVLHAGAMGYVMKNLAPKTIVAAIRAVRAGRLYLSAAAQAAIQNGQMPDEKGAMATATENFSDRELEIFLLIGQGFKKRDIAARIGRSGNTVDTHRLRIRRKLKLRSSFEVARLAFQYWQDGSRSEPLNIPR